MSDFFFQTFNYRLSPCSVYRQPVLNSTDPNSSRCVASRAPLYTSSINILFLISLVFSLSDDHGVINLLDGQPNPKATELSNTLPFVLTEDNSTRQESANPCLCAGRGAANPSSARSCCLVMVPAGKTSLLNVFTRGCVETEIRIILFHIF